MNAKNVEQEASPSFTVDGAYLREQASIAVRTFFAPLAGVAAALRTDPVERCEGSARR